MPWLLLLSRGQLSSWRPDNGRDVSCLNENREEPSLLDIETQKQFWKRASFRANAAFANLEIYESPTVFMNSRRDTSFLKASFFITSIVKTASETLRDQSHLPSPYIRRR